MDSVYVFCKETGSKYFIATANYLLEKNKSSFVPPYMIATIYMGLSDVDNTLKWLEKDAEAGGQGFLFWALKKMLNLTLYVKRLD